MFRWHRHRGFSWPETHLAMHEAVIAHARRADLKTLTALGCDAEQAIGQGVEINDARKRSDGSGQRRLANFAPIENQTDAETRGVARTLAHEVEIALLENAQVQRCAGKEHARQRK